MILDQILASDYGLFGLIFVAIALGAIVGIVWFTHFYLAPAKKKHEQAIEGLAEQTSAAMAEKERYMARLGRVRSAMSSDDRQIWMRYDSTDAPELAEKIKSSIPIITVANLKGGVGKTTLTANLAAYFEKARGMRVLLIDLDYQGSLSALALNAAHSFAQEETVTEHLIRGDRDPEWLLYATIKLGETLPFSSVLTSFYDFATIENQVMLEWLLGDRFDDARFTMAKYLHHPVVQDNYDMVILDCPPRLTTGVVNALTSSTHLLIPTKLDRMSGQAVVTFLRQLREMKPLLFPELDVLGVVGSMVDNSVSLTPTESGIWADFAQDLAPQWAEDVHLFKGAEIPQKSAVAAASGSEFVYLKDAATRELFNRLGDAIMERLDGRTRTFDPRRAGSAGGAAIGQPSA